VEETQIVTAVWLVTALGVALLSSTACAGSTRLDPPAQTPRQQADCPGSPYGEAQRRPWGAIGSWVYWLDGPRLDQIGPSGYDLAVIDYSQDGSANAEFSADAITALRAGGCGRRVVAYLSIGEAEDYRFYWQAGWRPGNPSWITARNTRWKGNYLVQFWTPEWQALVRQYVDRIVAAGFDGIYLDRVDAYQEPRLRGHEQDMVNFVLDIAAYARARSPLGDDFGVFVQNAEELGARHPDYVDQLTGIGREETYVLATNHPVDDTQSAATEALLNLFRRSDGSGLILTVDYADQADLIADACIRSSAQGFVPYVGPVGLDRMTLDAGGGPVCEANKGGATAVGARPDRRALGSAIVVSVHGPKSSASTS